MDIKEVRILTQMELENAQMKNYPRKMEWAQTLLSALDLLEKKENGLLIELPCVNGTRIYHANDEEAYNTMQKIDGNDNSSYIPGFTEVVYGEFGVDWFLSPEEVKMNR